MTSRFLSLHNGFAALIWLAIAAGAWFVWHTIRAGEVAELRAQVPDFFLAGKALATCNESNFWAIDRRAIFSGSLRRTKNITRPSGLAESWITGTIPESDFYNESSTFICPSLAPELKARILAASRNPGNLRRYGVYSVYWLPSERLLVVRHYND